ncbi:nucleoside-diphosphate-sugar epimerase [Nonomuraea polychroma]|uniref:Nucleoside-diphosphate-sugar epimerase n=1 Tax=Nonomuraea polychroma TaxID=46176 RepID=A0A438LZ19_9ACTN|nr:NAD-dependent epimerase/dehydratase [Nonomuraea polychroma]RVX38760.1 nucleoside-diphosphate-sugar epimerase [Nonomuraea polychroma]
MTKQLITVLGASGLLGRAVARELAARPVRLRLVARRPSPAPARARAEVEVRTVDLAEGGSVAAAVAAADVVIHLVAPSSGAGTWRAAATGPAAGLVGAGLATDLIDALRGRARPPIVLFAGSMSQVGGGARVRLDGNEPDDPLTVYDQQKLAVEQAIEAATAEGVVRGCSLRLATLYSRGPDHDADRGVLAAMARRALADRPLTMWHDGTIARDLLCADDCARAFTAALDEIDAVAGRHWLVGTGQATTIGAAFTMIAQAAAEHTGREPVPVVQVPPAETLMPTDLLDLVLDPSAFQKATGWAPHVPLRDGVESLVAAVARDAN